MVNTDILGALQSALARGHSLESAMQTLLNSGYPSSEIQEAAQLVHEMTLQPQPEATQDTSTSEELKQKVAQKQDTQKAEKSSKILVITLIIILAILLGALIAVFIFKDQIIGIFS